MLLLVYIKRIRVLIRIRPNINFETIFCFIIGADIRIKKDSVIINSCMKPIIIVVITDGSIMFMIPKASFIYLFA